MSKIQKDLGEKLHQSKEELDAIKTQVKGKASINSKSTILICALFIPPTTETELGVHQLQAQLKSREQELRVERQLRRQLELKLGSNTTEGSVQHKLDLILTDDDASAAVSAATSIDGGGGPKQAARRKRTSVKQTYAYF